MKIVHVVILLFIASVVNLYSTTIYVNGKTGCDTFEKIRRQVGKSGIQDDSKSN
jgi:hypothetical protein